MIDKHSFPTNEDNGEWIPLNIFIAANVGLNRRSLICQVLSGILKISSGTTLNSVHVLRENCSVSRISGKLSQTLYIDRSCSFKTDPGKSKSLGIESLGRCETSSGILCDEGKALPMAFMNIEKIGGSHRGLTLPLRHEMWKEASLLLLSVGEERRFGSC